MKDPIEEEQNEEKKKKGIEIQLYIHTFMNTLYSTFGAIYFDTTACGII